MLDVEGSGAVLEAAAWSLHSREVSTSSDLGEDSERARVSRRSPEGKVLQSRMISPLVIPNASSRLMAQDERSDLRSIRKGKLMQARVVEVYMHSPAPSSHPQSYIVSHHSSSPIIMSSTQVQTTYAHKLRSFRDLVPDGYQVRLDADTQSAPGDERTQRLDLFFGKEAASLHPGEDESQLKIALLSAYTCKTGGLTSVYVHFTT